VFKYLGILKCYYSKLRSKVPRLLLIRTDIRLQRIIANLATTVRLAVDDIYSIILENNGFLKFGDYGNSRITGIAETSDLGIGGNELL
jgi:hypothetical protein